MICLGDKYSFINFFLFAVSLQRKDADALSMYGTDIYSQGKTASFKIAASESKADRKFHFSVFKYQWEDNENQ